jgi:DNA-binding NarL/FixJ family response regulator
MLQSESQLTIAIVDDHPIVIEGLQKLLTTEFEVSKILEFISGDEFISFLKETKALVDIVLLDISLPGKKGTELCAEIKQIEPSIRILAFSNHNQRSIIMQMLQSGANGYLLKNASSGELVQGIREALQGQIVFSKEVREIIAKSNGNKLDTVKPLTKREKEILRMIAQGKTSNEIGKELFVSPLTVETHRRNLMQKFSVKNVAELIKISSELQFV